MKRILTASIAATALTAGAALADTVIVYDADLGEKFETKREIVDLVKATYGPTVVYDDGETLPEGLSEEIRPRNMLPEGTELEPVPEEIAGKLPHSEEGTSWHKVGEHLVEMKTDGTIVMVVYDVLK